MRLHRPQLHHESITNLIWILNLLQFFNVASKQCVGRWRVTWKRKLISRGKHSPSFNPDFCFSQEKVFANFHLHFVPQSGFKKILKFTFEAVVSFRVLLIFVRRRYQGLGQATDVLPPSMRLLPRLRNL